MSMATLSVLGEENFPGETRGMDYYGFQGLVAVSCNNEVLILKNNRTSYFCKTDLIESQHTCPTLVEFNSVVQSSESPSHILIADNTGPIDVVDLNKKSLLRSYREHGSKVTGISWFNKQSFISSSSDGTVRLYKSTDPHSYHSFNMYAGTCGACVSPFSSHLLAFGTTKGKFFVYDIRNTKIPYIEAMGHLKTVSRVIFVSDNELLTVGTDNTAKLWALNKTVCIKEYEGNLHQKFFVGLDALNDIIALGSEDTNVRIFNKHDSHCIASKSLSPSSFVCGCALTSVGDLVQLIVLGNQGDMLYLQLDSNLV